MANQVSLSLALGLSVSNTTLINWITGPLSFDQTGTRYSDVVQTITSIGSALAIPGGTLGFLACQNLDTITTNPIYIMAATGQTTGSAIAKLYGNPAGGMPLLIPLGPGMAAPVASVSGTTSASLKTIVFEF